MGNGVDELTRGFALHNRIDLAREPDFSLGPLRVRPSHCEVDDLGERRPVQRRVMQVLVALARSHNEVVSQRELIQRCWGGLSVTDDAIGRCIGQLRRLSGSWPEPPFEIETIPGVGYRLSATGRVPAQATAPAAAADPPRVRRRNLWPVIAAATLVLAGAGAWLLARTAERPAVRTPTIAVQAFQAPNHDAAAEALAASLPRRVADALSGYEVTVIAARPGAGASGADFVVSGRVAEKDHGLEVTADLLDARNGIVVYSFDTPEPADGKGDVAGEIANHVALSLDPTKLANDLGGKLTATDYTLIARANDAIDRWDMPYVRDQTQKLLARHPEDADLQASVAISAIYDAQLASPSQQPQLLELARRAVGRAEALSHTSGLLYVAKEMLVNGPMAYARQEQLLRRSLAVTPGLHVAYNGLGEVLLSVGRTNEGAALIKRSVQLDPMSDVVVEAATVDYVKAGDLAQASETLEREERIWPDDNRTRASEFYVAVAQDSPEPFEALRRAHPMNDAGARRLEASVGLQAWKTHDPRAIRALVADCFANLKAPGQSFAPVCLMQMVRLGAIDDAFRFAARVYPDLRRLYPPDSDAWVTHMDLLQDPAWLFAPPVKRFREDPRFWDVAARIGLAGYWRSTGSWPDFCAAQLARCKSLAAAALRTGSARPT